MKLDVIGYLEELRSKQDLKERGRLVIVQIGDDPASNFYIKSKMKEAAKWNVRWLRIKLHEGVSHDEVCSRVESLCESKGWANFHTGIILQLPIPKHLNYVDIIQQITYPMVDVDGLSYDDQTPCTPSGILRYLKHITDLENKNVVVLGRGKTVGKPLVKMLLKENCTFTVCNSHTSQETLKRQLKDADIVISAVGKPNMFCVDDLKESCIVIDAGISRINGKQVGDFSHEGDLSKVDYTPWTNGVGKLTVAELMMNVRKCLEED